MESIGEYIEYITDMINSFVWGYPMVMLLLGTGVYLSIKMRFFQFRYFGVVLKKTVLSIFSKSENKKKGSIDSSSITPFQALATALSSTIGTGNILGVATAIVYGGAGAVFWMTVSAFFGMTTMFCENILGINFRRKNKNGSWEGGTMCYLEQAFAKSATLKGLGKWLAATFAFFCIIASFGSGNMVQSNSIVSAIRARADISPIICGVVIALLASVVILGGVKRIGAFAEKLTPLMSLFYIIGAGAVIIINYKNIPSALTAIIKSAFGFDAVKGGFSGICVKMAVSMGFQRGVISNEAGLGTGAMIHSCADTDEPVEQGMWGIFQVFFDTIVICTISALALLCSAPQLQSINVFEKGKDINPVLIMQNAFQTALGNYAGMFLSISIILFAFTTVIGWCHFGERSVLYLFGNKAVIPYRIAYILFIILGASICAQTAWDIAANANGLMAVPNLIGVLALSKTAVLLKEDYEKRKLTPHK